MHGRLRAAVLAATVIAALPLEAQNLETFRFQVDNDWFDFSIRSVDRPDDNYTHGQLIRAVWNSAPPWLLLGRPSCAAAVRVATGPLPVCVQSYLNLNQQMYTPTDDSPSPRVGERPYAGVLFAEYGRQSVSPRALKSLAAIVGVTGEPSGAEWAQKLFHRLADLRRPQGWSHQVAAEPVLGLMYGQQYVLGRPPNGKRSFGNIVMKGSALATTIQEAATVGTEIHAGFNVPHPWMPVDWRHQRRVTGYIILGGNESWVARNVLLTGNTDETRNLVTRKALIPETIGGFAFGVSGVYMEYSAVGQGREYETGPAWHRWGAISIVVGTP
jgi:hypothetical protein